MNIHYEGKVLQIVCINRIDAAPKDIVGGMYSYIRCLRRLIIDHASLARRITERKTSENSQPSLTYLHYPHDVITIHYDPWLYSCSRRKCFKGISLDELILNVLAELACGETMLENVTSRAGRTCHLSARNASRHHRPQPHPPSKKSVSLLTVQSALHLSPLALSQLLVTAFVHPNMTDVSLPPQSIC